MKSVTTEFKSGGLHEKHVVATWNLGNHLSKALKEFGETDPTMRYQIPKQKCSRKLATIITTVNQEILPDYLKYNDTSFLELHNTIYAAAVATVRLSG